VSQKFLGSQSLHIENRRNSTRVHLPFSKQCNELPDIVDADVIGAFISGTANEALLHELGHNKPRITRELLDLAMSHAS
jgi:hypothetical protein